jgi:hypothetical protein
MGKFGRPSFNFYLMTMSALRIQIYINNDLFYVVVRTLRCRSGIARLSWTTLVSSTLSFSVATISFAV